jgi:hypothetical protein
LIAFFLSFFFLSFLFNYYFLINKYLQDTIIFRRRNKSNTPKQEGGFIKTLLSAVYLEKIEGAKVLLANFRSYL